MRIASLVCFGIAVLASASLSHAADEIAWGEPVNGMRLGAAFDQAASEPTIRVVLQNNSSEAQDLFLGYDAGKGPMYPVKFLATAPNGKEHEGIDRNLLFIAVTGLVLPVYAHIEPGATHELHFPLARIVSIASPKDIPFESFVKLQYAVRISFESYEPKDQLQKQRVKNPWLGKLTSAPIPLPK